MERCNSFKRSLVTDSLSPLVKPQRGFSFGSLSSPRLSSPQSQNLLKSYSPQSGRQIYSRRQTQPLILAVANTETKEFKFSGLGTPLVPSSPEGKLLSAILQSQRHFFQFAVSEQLDELASDRDEAAAARMKQSSGSMESVLHGRIAEMKEKERQIAIEDVMYMSIVHKFSEVEVPMVPKLSKCLTDNKLEIWPSKRRELESIHSVEVQEMIREHVTKVVDIREKSTSIDGETTTKLDRLHLGRIYAASIMYGYFIKSACFRRKLDLSLAPSSKNSNGRPPLHKAYLPASAVPTNGLAGEGGSTETMVTTVCQEPRGSGRSQEKLSSYVSGFDTESLQRCAKLKSKDAVNVIEKHTWALFSDENTGTIDPENDIVITIPSLERLVLEAITFGSFLWDVERSVDSVYGLNEI